MTASEQQAEYAATHTPTIGKKLRAAIEAALREEIAEQIEAEAALRDHCADWRDGMDEAANIARGEAR